MCSYPRVQNLHCDRDTHKCSHMIKLCVSKASNIVIVCRIFYCLIS